MSEFKTDFLIWVSTILEHLGVIGTGGIIVLLIQIAEKKWPHVFNWQTSRRVFLAFVMFAIFQSWQSEYLSRIGREKDLIRAHAENDGLRKDTILRAQVLGVERENAVSGAKAECAFKDGANETLQKQNRDQQSSINGCLTQAIGLIPKPEPFRQTILNLDNEFPANQNKAMKGVRFLVLANKTVTPVRVGIGCDSSIAELNVHVLGSMLGTTASRLSLTDFRFELANASWSPESPLVVSILYFASAGDIKCSVIPL